jgi:uncharacterized protein (DUF58 family)
MNPDPAWDAANAPSAVRAGAAAATRLRLPVDRIRWRGSSGLWRGRDLGSSLDFADHRRYVPGDDPRRIHWAAYARTGQVLMKLYHAEAAPVVDIALDVSTSMCATPAKAAATASLAVFALSAAEADGAHVRAFAGAGRNIVAIDNAALRAGSWMRTLPPATPGAPGPFPWRTSSFRVVITDLLFPDDPEPWIDTVTRGAGGTVILAPFTRDEAEPAWSGNVEFLDVESGVRRVQRVDSALLERFRAAYTRHLGLWREACRRRGAVLARVPAEIDPAHALAGEALREGAVEARR